MAESIFSSRDGRFVPSEQARGPWDPQALHGGAPAALITRAFERHEPQPETRVARLGFEFLRTLPFAPLTVTTRTVRPGRRVQELAAELHADIDGEEQLVCRASALRVQAIPGSCPSCPTAPSRPSVCRASGAGARSASL